MPQPVAQLRRWIPRVEGADQKEVPGFPLIAPVLMFSVYRLPLRNPTQPPSKVIARLHEELPGVEIGANGKALVFMAEDSGLGARVRSAVERVCGMGWREHFLSLDNGPDAA
jgi:hypothetical protein